MSSSSQYCDTKLTETAQAHLVCMLQIGDKDKNKIMTDVHWSYLVNRTSNAP
jgi:hypothetical protein